MEGLKAIPYLALVIAISGIVIGAGVIVSVKFRESVTIECYNSSYTYESAIEICNETTRNLTGHQADDEGGDVAYFGQIGDEDKNLSRKSYFVTKSIDESINAQGDIAEQLPTVGIIAIMVVIISIIAGVFVYLQYFS